MKKTVLLIGTLLIVATGFLSAQEYNLSSLEESGELFFTTGDLSASTNYSVSKRLEAKSFEKEYTYNAEEDTRSLRFEMSGTCKKGKIIIMIIRPDGKQEPELLIDDDSRISLSKRFKNKDGKVKLSGSWKIKVKAENATGRFSVDISSK